MENEEKMKNVLAMDTDKLPEVEPRGEFEHIDKGGFTHFFETPEKRAEFIAEENNPDNK